LQQSGGTVKLFNLRFKQASAKENGKKGRAVNKKGSLIWGKAKELFRGCDILIPGGGRNIGGEGTKKKSGGEGGYSQGAEGRCTVSLTKSEGEIFRSFRSVLIKKK